MDAMYLNLMFINPRPPVGAGAERRPQYTAVVDPPPPCKKSWIRAWPSRHPKTAYRSRLSWA